MIYPCHHRPHRSLQQGRVLPILVRHVPCPSSCDTCASGKPRARDQCVPRGWGTVCARDQCVPRGWGTVCVPSPHTSCAPWHPDQNTAIGSRSAEARHRVLIRVPLDHPIEVLLWVMGRVRVTVWGASNRSSTISLGLLCGVPRTDHPRSR